MKCFGNYYIFICVFLIILLTFNGIGYASTIYFSNDTLIEDSFYHTGDVVVDTHDKRHYISIYIVVKIELSLRQNLWSKKV